MTMIKVTNELVADLKQNLINRGCEFPIYLDNQATTKLDPEILKTINLYFSDIFGNPHSRSHSFGWDAEAACETAREQVANLISANSKEIIFTSGATEANNLAIKGVAKFYGSKKKHIITISTEHKCVINTCRYLEQEGFQVSYLPVQNSGLIDLNVLADAITDDTVLVSISAVNSEIGTIQPLKEIGKLCREKNVFFHSDIAQAFGKIPINVDELNIDLASISGHKIYAPKGIGALYVRRKPRVRISPLIHGGGQERGLRSGTLPTPLIVGFGKAAEIANQRMDQDYKHVKKLFDYFVDTIQSNASDVFLNGDRESRYPGNVNLSFSCIEGESMILAVKDLAVSSGSACTSASLEPSYVLRAIGVDEGTAHTSIRFGFSRFTQKDEVEYAAMLVISKIDKLRELSPLWEMVKEGIDINQIQWSTH